MVYEIATFLSEQDSLKPSELSLLFSMLRFNPEQEIVKFILASIPNEYHTHLAKILVTFVNKNLSSCDSFEWFYAVYLIHVFSRKVIPFANPSVFSEELKWEDNDVQLHLIKSTITGSRFVPSVYPPVV